jgi:hypothetical protein
VTGALQNGRRGDSAGANRGGEPQNVVPVSCNVVHIGESSDKGIEHRVRLLPWEEIEAAIF